MYHLNLASNVTFMNHAISARPVMAAVLAAALALVAGCNTLTAENYARVKVGMDYAEAKAILGTPDRCDEAIGLKTCVWGDAQRNATLRFVGDKVVFHSATNLR
jgi:hypothetical protein